MSTLVRIDGRIDENRAGRRGRGVAPASTGNTIPGTPDEGHRMTTAAAGDRQVDAAHIPFLAHAERCAELIRETRDGDSVHDR